MITREKDYTWCNSSIKEALASGKDIKCIVWDKDANGFKTEWITGYVEGSAFPYIGVENNWKNAVKDVDTVSDDVRACLIERFIAGDIEFGETCKKCKSSVERDGYKMGKIAKERYCEKGLWREEV